MHAKLSNVSAVSGRNAVPLFGGGGDPLFRGGGEMGRVMAACDWSATPLGPSPQWPENLRSVVRILLTSRFAMWMGWGPELTFFYNDAYRRDTLRAKHPWALGQPARDVWAEIWDDVGPRIDSVLSSGVATWDEDLLLFLERSGYPEETYHTFSYSPVDGADGAVEGVLCVVTEVTDRVLSERRMATLRDLAATMAATRTRAEVLSAVALLEGNPRDLPFSLTYLLDDDGTARLARTTGIEPGGLAAPLRIQPDDPDGIWPVTALLAGRTVGVPDLAERFPGLPTGAWDRPPTDAAVVPLPATRGTGRAPGFIVVGLNPYRGLDDRYRGFLELLANQIASGVVNAGSYEAERRRNEELAELDRVKTAFFSNVSHEFRTPLTLIMGPVAELRADPVLDPERLRAELDVVYRNGLRLGRLVNTLLDFSRLEAGRETASFRPVDLAAVTAELASMFRAATERAGLELRVSCPPLPQPVWVDRDMWEKVVLNLLSNAVKFTFTGSITVSARFETADGGPGTAVVEVTDTGIGVPESELARLFERFHQVRGVRGRSAEGSGIGLALAHELVGLHGGTISARSRTGSGTTFTIRLEMGRDHLPSEQVVELFEDLDTGPSGRSGFGEAAEPFVSEALRWLPGPGDAEATGAAADGDTGGSASTAALERGRVLIADDNADMREYLARLLRPRYVVDVVADGELALAAARADPPDLILSDVMMPGLDGIGLLGALRADPATSTVPVLLLSARAGLEAAVTGMAGGADGYLAKPFSAPELLARVDAHLELGRVRRAAEHRFRALADATPALIWVDGPDARRVFVNRAWMQFTGAADPDRDLGRSWCDRIHPDDRARYDDVRTAAERAGEPFELEYRLRRADGRHRWVLDRGAPLPSGGGTWVGGCLDVDGRRRDRERQRLLSVVGSAIDRETTVEARREVLLRTLVDQGAVDVAQLIDVEVDEAGTRRLAGVVAVAGSGPAQELLREIHEPFGLGRDVLAAGESHLIVVDEEFVTWASPDLRQQELRRRSGMTSAVLVPLVNRNNVVGMLTAGRTGASPTFTPADLSLLTEIGQRAATALDNAALLASERDTTRRLNLLQRATAALSAAASPQQVAEATVEQFTQLLGTPAVAVWELCGSSLEAVATGSWPAAVNSDWSTLPVDDATPVGTTALHHRPVWLDRAQDWLRDYPHMLDLVTGHSYVSVASLPLTAGPDCLGVVAIGFTGETELGTADRAAALSLAELSGQAMQRAGLLAAEGAARRAAEEFGDVVAALSGASTVTEVARVILDHTATLGADGGVVVLRNGEHLDVLASRDDRGVVPGPDHPIALDAAHPLAHAVRTGEPVWRTIRSATAWRDRGFDPTGTAGPPVHVVVPMLLAGVPIGAIGLHHPGTAPAMGARERAALLTVAGQCAQALDRARLHQVEHEIADTLQRSLLPGELPTLDGLDAAVRYLPGTSDTQAGGDWYGLLPIDDDRVALVVGDVVGHGPPAAAIMGKLSSAVAAYLLEGHSPAAALERLDAFAHHTPGARGSTCACLTLNRRTGELCWARAGHPPVLLLDNDGARFLGDGAGTVLDVPGRPPYEEAGMVITPGTAVVIYTDGLVERRGELVDDGLARLVDVATPVRHLPTEEVAAALVAGALTDGPPADDVALVVVRLLPRPLVARLPATAGSVRLLRHGVAAWAQPARLPDLMVEDLQLALGEAAANAAEHARPAHAGPRRRR